MTEVPQWRAHYPFESHEVCVQGMRYHYLDEGQGPTLLLVHGNPTWSFHWRNIVLGLRGRCRLVVPDHIGCGLSDKPQHYDYTLSRHVENLSELLEKLDLRGVTLVAQDWGGAIGLGAMLAAQERFSGAVLMNTGAFTSPHMPWRIAACRIPGIGPFAIRGLNGFARAALTMAVEKRERITPGVRAGILAPYDSWANRVATNCFVQDIPMQPSHPSYARLLQIEQGLPSLADRRIMLIWGMKDWCFTPWFLERFQQFFPAAQVHRFADCGHWVVEDAHERIVPLIDSFVHESQ